MVYSGNHPTAARLRARRQKLVPVQAGGTAGRGMHTLCQFQQG
jgi:hypothetical protein